MWATNLGNVGLTRRTDRKSEALAAYVRTEYGEANVDWYLVDVRRAAKQGKRERSPGGNGQNVDAGSVPA